MAKLTGDMIKAGLHVWVEGYANGQTFPLEVVIRTGKFESEVSKSLVVDLVNPTDKYVGVSNIPYTDNLAIYLGDAGVRPYNYDNRCTQVFTTSLEMQAAIDSWAGMNANFIDEEGNIIHRDRSFTMDFDYE